MLVVKLLLVTRHANGLIPTRTLLNLSGLDHSDHLGWEMVGRDVNFRECM